MKNAIITFGIVVIALSIGCRQKATAQVPATTDADKFRLAAEYSRESNGLSVLVMKGDKIVFEDYENGHTAERPWILASGTKSFSGVMLAAAIEDGIVSGFDEKVSDTITEWRSDPQRKNVTLRQLLSLTSGIDAGAIGRVPSYSDAAASSMLHSPGTFFQYGPVPFQTFGEFMTRKLRPKNETVRSYLKRRILDPIGLNVAMWREKDGQPLLPQGATLTAREWVKFGKLMRDGGKWNGKQIVANKYLDELHKGSAVNPAYGITFWLNAAGKGPGGRAIGGSDGVGRTAMAEGVDDLFMAAGAFNQRLYIIPSRDTVIVRQGRPGKWDDAEFIGRILFGRTKN